MIYICFAPDKSRTHQSKYIIRSHGSIWIELDWLKKEAHPHDAGQEFFLFLFLFSMVVERSKHHISQCVLHTRHMLQLTEELTHALF